MSTLYYLSIMKRLIYKALTITVLATVTLFFSWQPLFSSFLNWYICHQCHDKFSADCHIEKITKKENQWICHGIKASHQSFSFSSDALAVSFDFRPWRWQLDLHATLTAPHLDLFEQTVKKSTSVPWIQIRPHIEIENGTLAIHQSDGTQSDYRWNASIDWVKHKAGRFSFKKKGTEVLAVEVKQRGRHKVDATLHAANYPITDGYAFLKPLLLPRFSGEITEGVLSGIWKMSLTKNGIEHRHVDMKMQLSRFLFQEAECFIPALTITSHEKSHDLHCHIHEGSSLSLGARGSGDLIISPDGRLQLDLQGKLVPNGQKILVSGVGTFDEEHQELIQLNLHVEHPDREPFKARFFGRNLGENCHCIEAELTNLGAEESTWAQSLFDYNAVKVEEGSLDAAILFFIEDKHITEVLLENLLAKKAKVEVIPWNLSLAMKELSGRITMNLRAPNLLRSIDGELSIYDGKLGIIGLEENKLSKIQTKLFIEKGIVQRSKLEGRWAGLKAEITVDGTDPDHLLKLYSQGDAAKLNTIMPTSMEDKWIQMLPEEQVELQANVALSGESLVLEGIATLSNVNQPSQLASFGFDIEKVCGDSWASLQLCTAELKNRPDPIAEIELPWMKRQLHVAGFRVKNGWFSASSLPLQKYVAPFLFDDDDQTLTGEIDVLGTFDHDHFSAEYKGKEIAFESEYFLITIPEITTSASYQCLFETGNETGKIPVVNGTYLEKNSGLLFNDVNTTIEIANKKIFLPKVETFCKGIYFAGEINLDDSAVDIQTTKINGKFSQLQQLLSHFKSFSPLPFEGHITQRQQGLSLHFGPDQDFNLSFFGALNDGVAHIETQNIGLQDLSLNFSYDMNTLAVSDIEAALLVGRPNHAEEYLLAGDYLKLDTEGASAFDLWLGDRKRDLIRLKGETTAKDDLIEMHLDRKRSHFGDVYPKEFAFNLTKEGEVSHFKLNLDANLESIRRVAELGVPLLSSAMAKKFHRFNKTAGHLTLDLQFEKDQNLFTFELAGNNLQIDHHFFKKALLSGRKSQHKWSIEQCQAGPYSLAAELLSHPDHLKVEFLGAQYGDGALVGLEGLYNYQQQFFDGNLNLLEVNLEQLGVDKLSGKIKGQGAFSLQFDQERKIPDIETTLELNLKKIKYDDIAIQDVEKVSCSYTSDEGITLRNLQTTFLYSGVPPFTTYAKRVNYNPTTHEFQIGKMEFSVPPLTMQIIAAQMQSLYPDAISDNARDTLISLKKDGELKGHLDFEKSGPHSALHLKFKDGDYQVWGSNHYLTHFVCDYDPCEFRLQAQYQGESDPFWVTMISRSPTLSMGEVIFSDTTKSSLGQVEMPLTLEWTFLPDTGFLVEKAYGNFSGLNVDLQRDYTKQPQKPSFALTGEIGVDFSRAKRLLTDDLARGVDDHFIGDGYLFTGNWHVHMTEAEDFPFQYYFFGDLVGKNCTCKGYLFENLRAHINASPSSCQLENLEITDSCGTLSVPSFKTQERPEGNWWLTVPEIYVKNFRPSLLREVGVSAAAQRKPLIIDYFELFDLEGDLDDSSQLTARGNLHFSNPARSHLQNTLLAFPAEILSTLGLDLKVLNPVVGTVEMEMEEGKFYLTNFKDVYSEGKLSKFYLPHNGHRSYVDLDGRLNAQVRMKQYNIFFKFAELFTVSVKGDLLKPTYTLTKQSKKHPK